MFRTLAAAVLAAALALPALADEVWALPNGNQVTYVSDEGNTAVLGYTPVMGVEQSFIFVPGLGGNTDNRATFTGYWVEPVYVGKTCAAGIVAPDGLIWERWGIVELKFQKKGFPSKITMKRGDCFAAPTKKIILKPVVGAGLE
ncbi:MAG: hypothetical protein WEA77_10620 [Hyphomonas sp.]|uniref:hypothetical protein n=1 Tax=Hyphomonas sp. TaxID=87 RepID=UPI0034A0101D